MKKLTESDLSQIESLLGLALPNDVREKYLESNGFFGPTSIPLLFPFDTKKANDIVCQNIDFKSEEFYPDEFNQLILIGADGLGAFIGFDHSSNKAVLWYPEDGSHFSEEANTVTEIWQNIILAYENG